MADAEVPIDTIKTSMRASWMAGDFGVVAKTITGGAEAFVRRLGTELTASTRCQ